MTKETKKIQKKLAIGLCVAVLGASLLAEKFVQIHPVAGIDGRPFFHAWFGFGVCVVLVLFSKFLGFFIKRQESYYKEKRND